MTSGGSARSNLLDLLRALAVSLVLARHGILALDAQQAVEHSWNPLSNAASNGWLGVDLFFVLSGFLLSRQLSKSDSILSLGVNSAIPFWRRRAYRILPTYLFVVFFLWLTYPLSHDGQGAGSLELLVHLAFLQDYFRSSLLIPTWSLATEEKFYLLLPFIILISDRISRNLAIALIASSSVAILVFRILTFLSVAPTDYPQFFWTVRAPFHLAIDGLLLGVAAGYAVDGRASKLSTPALKAVFWCGSLVGLFVLCATTWIGASPELAAAVVIWFASLVFSIVVLSGTLLEKRGALIASFNATSHLSRVSYPLYLAHYPMIPLSMSVAGFLTSELPMAYPIVFLVLYLCASLCAAQLLHLGIEAPFLRLRDRVRRRTGTVV